MVRRVRDTLTTPSGVAPTRPHIDVLIVHMHHNKEGSPNRKLESVCMHDSASS